MDDEAIDPFEVVFAPVARRALDRLPMPMALAALRLISGDLAAKNPGGSRPPTPQSPSWAPIGSSPSKITMRM